MADVLGTTEGMDYLLNNTLVGKTVWIAVSTKAVMACNVNSAAFALPAGTVTVDDNTAFPASGNIVIVSSAGAQAVAYTGKTGSTAFTGCTGGTGTVPSGALVYAASGAWLPTDTLAASLSEVTYWTGGGRVSFTVPASSSGVIAVSAQNFLTGANSNGPANAASIALVTSADNSGKLIQAENINVGGGVADLSKPNTTLTVSPTIFLRNPGGS